MPNLACHLPHYLVACVLALLLPPIALGQPFVPDELKYIFDLPWCKRWEFRCFRCEKAKRRRFLRTLQGRLRREFRCLSLLALRGA
jgi:hypothetical protein